MVGGSDGDAVRARRIRRDGHRRGSVADPDDVVLTASTSESYSWLFKLLCDPAETVLVPVPSYPLFEHLTRLEAVQSVPYRLEYQGRWVIDVESVSAAPEFSSISNGVTCSHSGSAAAAVDGAARITHDGTAAAQDFMLANTFSPCRVYPVPPRSAVLRY